MKINNINQYNLAFNRRLTSGEEQDYKNNGIIPALDYLGTNEVAMIIHGSSYPQNKNDIGVGSCYGKVAAQLIPFELLHGFSSNQLGPCGELSSVREVSPYKSSVGTKNYLFIDFEKLTENDYGNLLKPSDITCIANNKNVCNRNWAYSNFPNAFANYDYLIKKAYNNYKKSEREGLQYSSEQFSKLHNEKIDFYSRDWKDLDNAAYFHVLSKHYGTDDFTKWDEIDKNLCNKNNESTRARKEYLIRLYYKDMDAYKFGQFILNKQINENANLRKDLGFKYISDMLVGFSPADEWAHQELFLKGYRMGCPYGGPDGGLQKWDVPVLDPNKLFYSDGSLGEAGKYLKLKLDKCLTNFENVRIDHVLGLVDPYIYSKDGSRQGNINNMPDLDPGKNFQKVLDKIILPTLEEHGIDKNYPVWEDLVASTPVFEDVYYHKHRLPGITPLEYIKGEVRMGSKNWALVGSHDSDPAQVMIKKDWVRQNEAWNPMYLAGLLDPASDSSEYCKKIDFDDSERVKAKFAELFLTGDKVQISFADFFGIDKAYNQGGNDKNPNNWKLRLPENYEEKYYENLSSDHPTAINMPEILKMAVQAKAETNIVKGENPDNVWDKAGKILFVLDKYAKILKE